MSRKRGGLEIDRADTFAAREVQLQRVGLGVLLLFVIAGAAGLFGNGPLSSTRVASGNLAVEYERFTRQTASQVLIVEATTAESPARIGFDSTFLEKYSVEDTRPLHVQSEADGNQIVFLVPAENGVARLELRLVASGPGIFTTRVSHAGNPSAEIRQIVFF